MEITLGVIFAIIFVSSYLSSEVSAYSLTIHTATFQMLQQHPQLRTCMESVLHESKYFGCRVFERTGQCQGLTRSWGLNKTIEEGYAYATKVDLTESFQPTPLTLSKSLTWWGIPVVLNAGARIDISMSIPSWDLRSGEVFSLHMDNGSSLHFSIRVTDTLIEIREYIIKSGTINWLSKQDISGDRLTSNGIFKISLLVQPHSLVIFVDDEEVTTFQLPIHICEMKWMKMYIGSPGLPDVNVHGVKFTGVL